MTFKSKMKAIKEGAIIGTAMSTVYLTVILAVNAVALPFVTAFNGLERAVGAETKTETLTLTKKNHYSTPNMDVDAGNFKREDGKNLELFDTGDILAGKFFSNYNLDRAKTGETYQVTYLKGPLSSKVLSMEAQR